MQSFYCQICEQKFESQGEKLTWDDPVLGVCWKMIAKCPNCHNKANEIKVAMKSLKKNAAPTQTTSSCATGACPFVN